MNRNLTKEEKKSRSYFIIERSISQVDIYLRLSSNCE